MTLNPASILLSGLLIFVGCTASVRAEEPDHATEQMFTSGEGGYHTYRIPAAVQAANGDILLFVEGRRNSRRDDGDIDILLRRSSDRGRTWSEPVLIAREEGDITIGNPTPIVNRRNGALHLLFSRNNQRAFHMVSRDHGATWSDRREITDVLAQFDTPFTVNRHGIGPTGGIQHSSGRLLAPIWLNERIGEKPHYRAAVLYSDDDGETWHAGGVTSADETLVGTDENTVIELPDGTLYMTQRTGGQRPARAFAISRDRGETWQPSRHEQQFSERMPPVKAGIAIGSDPRTRALRYHVVFTAPTTARRSDLGIWMSRDNARTWHFMTQLTEGPAAYSEVLIADDGTILVFAETGSEGPYEFITLHRFTLEWLTRQNRQ